MAGTTRGPLPARVYWVRRLMVLGIATLLVVGLARMLGGSSDASSASDSARNVAKAGSPPADRSVSGGRSAVPPASGRQEPRRSAHPTTRAAVPTGPCAPSDVDITASVPKPVAGRDITVALDISSLSTPACTWTLSRSTVAITITSGSDMIWTSADCPQAIPDRDLVLREADPTRVKLTWDARRSESGCPVQTEWALPGTYHVHAAALGGRPHDTAFLLTAPSPAEVTRTAHPHRHGKQGKGKHRQQSGH